MALGLLNKLQIFWELHLIELLELLTINAGVPQSSILGPTLSLLYNNELPDDAILNISIAIKFKVNLSLAWQNYYFLNLQYISELDSQKQL